MRVAAQGPASIIFLTWNVLPLATISWAINPVIAPQIDPKRITTIPICTMIGPMRPIMPLRA